MVVGRRTSGGGYSTGDYDSGWFDWDGYDTNQDAYEPPPPARPDDWSECMDRRIDDLAEQAANLMNRMPDVATREYGYLIWTDAGGGLHLSNLIEGDNYRLTGLPTSTPQSLGFDSWSQVVGMVHSHPTQALVGTNPDGSPRYVDVPPESHFELPSEGDWDWLDDTFSMGNDHADMLRTYVLYDGSLYEYDLYNNPDVGTSAQRRAASQLATNANGECP